MAPRLTPAELDFIGAPEVKGMAPIAIHDALVRKRTRRGVRKPWVICRDAVGTL